jgi:3,4-dihydroxy 2-butanone 4-phosphate synthase / GTP cyclohydrolase II
MKRMSTQLIEKLRNLVTVGGLSRSGLARAAGLHANTLRDLDQADWNPTADTLRKLESYLFANDDTPALVPIEEIIEEARNGRMYILVDDEDRENEGDLIIPAQMATPDAINFMATHGRGLICLAITKKRCDQLGLGPMTSENRESMETAFTVSIEAKEGVTTGISAADRARTISVAVDASKGPQDIVSPGHVFPLTARDGGVLVRAGHTEAAVDISRLAGLNPSGVICEIMKDLIEYHRRHDHLVERVNEAPFTSDYGGDWRAITYKNKIDGTTSLVLMKGHVNPEMPTLVRMHGISIYSDLLGQPGPRKRALQRSMDIIGAEGAGVIVVLFGNGPDAFAREIAGAGAPPPMDLRNYGIGAQILADLGIHDMTLLTNAHRNVVGLDGYGLNIVGERPIADA